MDATHRIADADADVDAEADADASVDTADPSSIAVTCPDCAAVQLVPRATPRSRAVCFRCAAVLARGGDASRERALALTLGAIPLFIAANAFPLLRMAGAGEVTTVTMPGAARALLQQGWPALAAVVLLTTVVLPALQLIATVALLAMPAAAPRPTLRFVEAMRPWAQGEILLLGVLVAFGKLVTLFRVTPGIGLWCLVGFLVLDRLAHARLAGGVGALARRHAHDSLGRTSALLIAAAVLFLPANLLPVMTTRTLLRAHSDTILSGVAALWRAGSCPLAALVFVASIVVPALKIMALGVLAISTHTRSRWRRGERTRLYRLVESVGRWSMLDIFVMAVLAALVRSQWAAVEIHPGALAFAAVVVLTMLASSSFDPRLIWSAGKDRRD